MNDKCSPKKISISIQILKSFTSTLIKKCKHLTKRNFKKSMFVSIYNTIRTIEQCIDFLYHYLLFKFRFVVLFVFVFSLVFGGGGRGWG